MLQPTHKVNTISCYLHTEVHKPHLQHSAELQMRVPQDSVVVTLLRLLHELPECPPVHLQTPRHRVLSALS